MYKQILACVVRGNKLLLLRNIEGVYFVFYNGNMIENTLYFDDAEYMFELIKDGYTFHEDLGIFEKDEED